MICSGGAKAPPLHIYFYFPEKSAAIPLARNSAALYTSAKMIAEYRDLKEKLALYTDSTEVERRLKKLKSHLYSVPYYDTGNGKIVGVDLYFDRSARSILRRVAASQLPLF